MLPAGFLFFKRAFTTSARTSFALPSRQPDDSNYGGDDQQKNSKCD